MSLELHKAIPAHREHMAALGVLDGRQGRWHRSGTHAVVLHRCLHRQCLVGPVVVVDLTPALHRLLRLGQAVKGPPSQHLGLQRAVKALDLSVGLRMVRTAVAAAHAQADQPDIQGTQVAWGAG